MILAALVAVAIGGLAFVFTPAIRRPTSGRRRCRKGGVKAKDESLEKIARKKQITDSLKELEKKARSETREFGNAGFSRPGCR